jgi:hypothetical protein
LLAAAANDLHQAMTRSRLLAYVILDGTLIPSTACTIRSRTTPESTDGTG